MASKKTICNMAVSHVKGSLIVDLNEGSAEAEACNTFFQTCLDFIFADTEWNFLNSMKPLTEINILGVDGVTTVHEYFDMYAYSYNNQSECEGFHAFAYPADASKVIAVGPTELASRHFFNDNAMQGIDFKIMQGESDKIIVTHRSDVTVYYVKRVDDITQLSPQLVLCLSHLLATYISMPILGGSEGRQMKQDNNEAYLRTLAAARTHDASQSKRYKTYTPMLDHYQHDHK